MLKILKVGEGRKILCVIYSCSSKPVPAPRLTPAGVKSASLTQFDSIYSAMDETALDTAPSTSDIYLALEAACLLDNERSERLTEEEERASGILRPALTGEKQMARRRTRKLALVIGNGKGPGGLDTPVCRADAQSVAMHLGDLGVTVTLLLDCTLDQILDAIADFKTKITESDLVIFYFSGHGRSANGVNYLIPSGGPVDNLDTTAKFATRALNLREDVIKELQTAIGTLTFIILDCFRASQAISAPAGCGMWRQGKGDWQKRIPPCFIPHIRPPGLASSNLVYPSPEPGGGGDADVSLESGLDEDGQVVSTPQDDPSKPAPPGPYMEGNIQGIPKNTWAVLAGDSLVMETNLEEDLADEASLCLVYRLFE